MSSGKFLDKSLKFDWIFLIVTLALIVCGVTLVYTATANENVSFVETFWFRQILYFVGGSVLAMGIVFLKIDWLKQIAVPFYVVSLILLCIVLFIAGDVVKGAGRWIDLGIFKLQPSEFAKIAYLLVISFWLSRHPVSLFKIKTFVVPLFLFIVPFLLVLKQPDLSTALVFTAVTYVAFFFSGLTFTDMFLIASPILSVGFSYFQNMNPSLAVFEDAFIPQSVFFQVLWGLLICAVVFALVRRRLPKVLTIFFVVANILAG